MSDTTIARQHARSVQQYHSEGPGLPLRETGVDYPLPVGSGVFTASGTIDALNEMVELDCPGAKSAIITVAGTFSGTVTVTGSGDTVAGDGIQGERLLFKSGVGSTGRNFVKNTGTAVSGEYRVVVDGRSLRVKATAWSSGSAVIKITATTGGASTVSVNGPVHDAEEEATRAARAFVAATGLGTINASDNLYIKIANPSDSGVNLFVSRRIFANGSANTLAYQAFGSPTGALTQTATSVNRRIGEAASTNAVITYQFGSGITLGGTAGTSDILPPSSSVVRNLLAIQPPGSTIGFIVSGAGGGNNSAQVGVTLDFYEEALN